MSSGVVAVRSGRVVVEIDYHVVVESISYVVVESDN